MTRIQKSKVKSNSGNLISSCMYVCMYVRMIWVGYPVFLPHSFTTSPVQSTGHILKGRACQHTCVRWNFVVIFGFYCDSFPVYLSVCVFVVVSTRICLIDSGDSKTKFGGFMGLMLGDGRTGQRYLSITSWLLADSGLGWLGLDWSGKVSE